ncbi:HAD family hydrolase [Vagococcus elongatus]|uniref:HAD family hydrolase n=1 Tax=Vagococcus elongatus TaxID=180344 RepID=A0A430B4C5_9ENTE|nr:HAD family hydrolase [Vagococcus elongatus]RSU15052.1 hypothetical protein CBF29_01555 [Vagococcus elongatus]
MTKKLIAFDLDGTLLNDQRQVTERNKKLIRQLQAEGHFVMIATGRSLSTSRGVIEESGIHHYALCNGGYAFVNHQLSYEKPLPKSDLVELMSLCNEWQLDAIYHSIEGIKSNRKLLDPVLKARLKAMYGAELGQGVDIEQDTIFQATIYITVEQQKKFEKNLDRVRLTRWGDGADAIPASSSKAKTIHVLAQKHGIKPKNIITFGDGENDIEMLKEAGTGIAMANASAMVKASADIVTKSNEEDGIYCALKELELI